MGDEEFLDALELCTLPADAFGHVAHVRAAYLYLRRASLDAALEDVRRSLRRYVAHLEKAYRYNDVMTRDYVRLIHARIVERGDANGWTAFARENQDLFTIRV